MNRPEPAPQPIVDFYRGLEPDSEGRMIDEVWAWNHVRLEAQHDYVQWLFPLPEPSQYNPSAPLLDDRQIETFCSDAALVGRLRASLDLMLDFYGLERVASGTEVVVRKAVSWFQRKEHWVTCNNHNYKRLTRILIALNELGAGAEAAALFVALDAVYAEHPTVVDSRTHRFWRHAANPRP